MPENEEWTDERQKVLLELADNIIAGRRLWKIGAWVGGIVLAVSVLAYNVVGMVKGGK